MIPLKIMYDFLCKTGFAYVADGSLLATIHRVAAFGISLVPLDIRKESTKHTLVIDAIA